MRVKDALNRDVEIRIAGTTMDTVIIQDAHFIDTHVQAAGEEVDIEYLLNKYCAEIKQEWLERVNPEIGEFQSTMSSYEVDFV